MKSFKKVAKNSAWLILDKISRIGLKLLSTIIVANYLGSELFGVVNYSISIVAIFFGFASLGLNGIVVQELIKHPHDKEIIIANSLWLKLIAAFLSCLLAITTGIILVDDSNVIIFIIILGLGYCFKSFEIIDYWLQSLLKSKLAVVSRVVALFIITGFQLIAVWLELDIIYIIVSIALEFVIVALFYLYFYLKEHAVVFTFSRAVSFSLLSKSWPLILSAIGAIIYLKSDQIMIEYFLSREAVGVYAVAVQFSEIWYFVPNAIAISLFPILVKKSKLPVFKDIVRGSYSLMFIAGVLVGIVVTIVGPLAIKLLYKPEFWEAGQILVIHIWAGVFVFMRTIFSKWLIIEERFIHSLSTHLIGAFVNVLLNIILIPEYGIYGAAIATLISYGFSSYFSLWLFPSLREAAVQMSLGMFMPIKSLKPILKHAKTNN